MYIYNTYIHAYGIYICYTCQYIHILIWCMYICIWYLYVCIVYVSNHHVVQLKFTQSYMSNILQLKIKTEKNSSGSMHVSHLWRMGRLWEVETGGSRLGEKSMSKDTEVERYCGRSTAEPVVCFGPSVCRVYGILGEKVREISWARASDLNLADSVWESLKV